jgi:hypothetical protein
MSSVGNYDDGYGDNGWGVNCAKFCMSFISDSNIIRYKDPLKKKSRHHSSNSNNNTSNNNTSNNNFSNFNYY